MAKLWFFSDPHFGHSNIIDYCQRPFASAAEMDEHIIERVNSVVKPGDHWFCLGDWSIKRPQKDFAKKLNGRGRLIMGNHDIYRVEDYLAAGIEKVMAYRVINGIMFSHIPIHPASFSRFRANVHGHIHNNDGADYGWPYINLSVEVINYTPVSLEELEERIRAEGPRYKYDRTFGDYKTCECEHDYYRHFDTYSNMDPVGCKYCACPRFAPNGGQ